MAILTCLIPSFPIALWARDDPALPDRPAAVIGVGDRVVDATPAALRTGVAVGQTARQARLACPDLACRSADPRAYAAETEAFLAVLDDFAARVEPWGPGRAYLDVPDLALRDAALFCRDMGRQVRERLGAALQPAIGCDSGKFTAHAAASYTRPGALRVVSHAEARPFLGPLPVGLLPLDEASQLRLGYLGIRTLGQYAGLPPRAILQQFGNPGRTAHAWARGQDDRPVVARQQRPVITLARDFDAPIDSVPRLLDEARRLLAGPLSELDARFQGAQTLHAAWELTGGRRETEGWALPAPTADLRALAARLAARWEGRVWDGAVVGLTLTLGEIGDVWGEQLSWLTETSASSGVAEVVRRLRVRYGAGQLAQAMVRNALDLRVERRAVWREAS